jgi:EmrB/QacA subfamily drug resistance transporter
MEAIMFRWWAVGVLSLAILVVSLDITILNVALPTLSNSLHAGTSQLQWIVDAYSLALAAAMLPAGLLGDRFGRKRVLLGGMVILVAGSVWSAMATSVGELIAARALTGISAAIILPLTIAIVSATFDDKDRPKAIAAIMAAVAGGMPLGPIVGGALLQHFYWGSVFWINVPVVGLALVAGATFLEESKNPAAPRLDLVGSALAVGGIVALVYGVIRGPEHGWTSMVTIVLLAGSVVLLVGFVGWERRAPAPLINGALFRNPRFAWGTAATVVVSVALAGILFTIPQYLQSVLGYDVFGTGLRIVPFMGGLLVAGGLAGPAEKVAGTKVTVVVGLCMLAAGLVVLSFATTGSSYGVIIAGLLLGGFGVGASMASAMDAVTAAVGGDEAGSGAAVTNTFRQVGSALAIAGLGSVLAAVYTHRLGPALHGLPAPAARAARESVTAAVTAAGRIGPAGAELRHSAGVAYTAGMSAALWCTAAMVLLGAVLCAVFLPGRPPTGVVETTAPVRVGQ